MAAESKKPAPDKERGTADYYKLHTRAVDDLVTADESNSPVVSDEELAKYRSGPKLKFADWAKAILVKMWFAGSVCFFIFWGLGNYISARLDMLAVFGAALGVVTDLLTNNALRFLAKTKGGSDRWMMFPQKKYVTFPLNILYAFVLLACVELFYNLLNAAILALTHGAPDTVPLGVEPILFGVFYTGADLLFLLCRRTLRAILSDAKRKVG